MRSMVRKRWLAAVWLALPAQAALADVPLALDRFNLSIGGFFPNVDGRVSLSGPGIEGTPVDFSRGADLDKHRTLPNLHAELLVLDSQGFSVGGYQYSKTERASLSRDFGSGNDEFSVAASAQAGLRIYTYNAAWHWWLEADDRDVIGLGLGAVYYQVKGTLEASLSVGSASLSAHGAAETDAVAPLLTLAWRHAFSGDLRMYFDVSGVRKNSGTVTGHLLNATLGAEWYPLHNLGIALEYSSNALSLKATKQGWQGRASIDFRGPALFARMRF